MTSPGCQRWNLLPKGHQRLLTQNAYLKTQFTQLFSHYYFHNQFVHLLQHELFNRSRRYETNKTVQYSYTMIMHYHITLNITGGKVALNNPDA